MVNICVRGLPEGVHAAIRLKARLQGRSLEAQMRLMLERAALPGGRFKLGSALRQVGEQVGGVELMGPRAPRRPKP